MYKSVWNAVRLLFLVVLSFILCFFRGKGATRQGCQERPLAWPFPLYFFVLCISQYGTQYVYFFVFFLSFFIVFF